MGESNKRLDLVITATVEHTARTDGAVLTRVDGRRLWQ